MASSFSINQETKSSAKSEYGKVAEDSSEDVKTKLLGVKI